MRAGTATKNKKALKLTLQYFPRGSFSQQTLPAVAPGKPLT